MPPEFRRLDALSRMRKTQSGEPVGQVFRCLTRRSDQAVATSRRLPRVEIPSAWTWEARVDVSDGPAVVGHYPPTGAGTRLAPHSRPPQQTGRSPRSCNYLTSEGQLVCASAARR